ncbi:MAG: aldehyde ferredoxin oxidoreductase family protein [Syntrophaceae bacterium]|nr:aldehyde ferredoxin oxidoreductase family protein [Syntrophaceae bacterium]
MYGNTGEILLVDLSSETLERKKVPEEYYHNYIGGAGLAARLFWDWGDFKAQPLDPGSLLIFMNGPFAGIRLSGCSRGSVAGRSPLTGHWGDSSCGGHFAPELRFAGFDGIVIRGQSHRPCAIVIEPENLRILPADEWWGLGVFETTSRIRAKFGKRAKSLAIGQAGENLVDYACIVNDNHHAFGRAGYGAVMGSKRLKAIIVKSFEQNYHAADPEGLDQLRRSIDLKIRESVTSQVLHENGTAANLEGGVHTGDVPIKNFRSSFWEEMAEALTGSTLSEKYLKNKAACAFCKIACKRVVEINEGPFAIPKGPGPEYETIAAFGSMLGSMDLAATCKAGRLCNDYGMDTITAGSTIAWAMEAFEKSALTPEDTNGLPLKWGDMKTVVDILLPQIAFRNGKLGGLLSLGSHKASLQINKGSGEYLTTSKGLEAPMHDPRGGGHGLALTYSISHRGACHTANPMLFMEMGACYYPEIGFEYELEPMSEENKAESALLAVQLGAIENSSCYCQFADREITIPEWVDLFNFSAGYNWTIENMMSAGLRVFYLQRLLNFRFGLTADDDSISMRLLEPAVDGAPEGVPVEFDSMKKRFYQLARLDEIKGIPDRATLDSLGMSVEASYVWN